MKEIIRNTIIVIIIIFIGSGIGSGINETWKYNVKRHYITGTVIKVEYLQGGFGATDMTVFYMKDKRVIPLRKHHSIRLGEEIKITLNRRNEIKLIEYDWK